jgi:hypothetical protein
MKDNTLRFLWQEKKQQNREKLFLGDGDLPRTIPAAGCPAFQRV